MDDIWESKHSDSLNLPLYCSVIGKRVDEISQKPEAKDDNAPPAAHVAPILWHIQVTPKENTAREDGPKKASSPATR